MTKKTIQDLGEFGLIEELTSHIRPKHRHTLVGIGDDAAVIEKDHKNSILISTDMLIENIHFDIMYTPLKHLGYKAVAVNLSDIYAMNATPYQITLSIGLSSKYSFESLKELYNGIETACSFYNIDLIGGDTTTSMSGLILSISAIGEAETKNIVYRNGCQIGDVICVSGDLGAAYLGLQILEREKQVFLENPQLQPELENHQYLIERLLKPEPRKDIIDQLAKLNCKPTAMIDVSDGLSSELFHICRQSNCGAVIQENKIPIHLNTQELAIKFGIDPTTCALNGGEDYELLFTIDPKDLNKIQGMDDIAVIGKIVPKSEGLKLKTGQGNHHSLVAQGWNHFIKE